MKAHVEAVRSALKTNEELNRLIGQLGTGAHPRGQVLVAYRNARRALVGGLAESAEPWRQAMVVRDVMGQLRAEVVRAMLAIFGDAVALGVAQAGRQLRAWDEGGPGPGGWGDTETAEAAAAVAANVDAQRSAAVALAIGGQKPELITGNEQRQGVLLPGPVVALGAFWVASLAAGAWRWHVDQNQRKTGVRWMHQAVAAIDERTTDCCLQVHGQVQPIAKPFRLTGEPRYADELDAPPFHWYCRTSEAMVPEKYAEDELTQEMADAAKAELRARGPGGKDRVEIHPADARSRR